MSATSAIMGAISLIVKSGWVQGQLCTADGYCIVGALKDCCESEAEFETCLGCLRRAANSIAVKDWNDEQNRTKRQVLTMMKQAVRLASSEDRLSLAA